MAVQYRIKLTGDTKIVATLEKQIMFAAKQAVIAVTQESQAVVLKAIQAGFHVRGSWLLPAQRHGIHVRFTKDRNDLTSRLETSADWLLEHETGEDKTPDKHQGHLTVPHAARPTIQSVVPTANKARRILPNVSELASRRLRFSAAKPSKNQGKRSPRFKDVPFFMNRAGTAIFERLPDHRLRLFYTLTDRSHIHRHSTVIEPTIHTVTLRFGPIFNDKLRQAIATAK